MLNYGEIISWGKDLLEEFEVEVEAAKLIICHIFTEKT